MSRIWIGLILVLTTAVGTGGAQQPGAPAGPRPGAVTKPAATPAATTPAAGSETLTVLKAGTPEHVRVICRVSHVPVSAVAQTIGKLLRGEGQLIPSGGQPERAAPARSVVLVPDVLGNLLLLAGPPDAVKEVQRLIEELDQPPGMLVLEVVVGEAPVSQETPAAGSREAEGKPSAGGPAAQVRAVERPPKMEIIGRGRLTAMNNQSSQIQIGTRVPPVAGTSSPSTPGRASEVSAESVGLTLAVTPRIIPGAVVMEIDVIQSQLGPDSESVTIGFSGNQPLRSAKIDTTVAKTTVRIADGQAMVLGSIARTGKPDKELLIVVTPHIIQAGGAKP
jgi:type II secretory pathway component GspD/PulD (secretin)